MDLSKQFIVNQEFLNEFPLLLREIIKRLNDGAFEKQVDKEIFLPNGEISNIISINITQENLKNFFKSLSSEDAISLINRASNYLTVDEQKGILNNLKSNIENNNHFIEDLTNNVDQYINFKTFKITTFFDEEGFQRKVLIDLDLLWYINEDETFHIKGKIEKSINDINQEVIFDKELPGKDEIIDFNDFNQIQDININ